MPQPRACGHCAVHFPSRLAQHSARLPVGAATGPAVVGHGGLLGTQPRSCRLGRSSGSGGLPLGCGKQGGCSPGHLCVATLVLQEAVLEGGDRALLPQARGHRSLAPGQSGPPPPTSPQLKSPLGPCGCYSY